MYINTKTMKYPYSISNLKKDNPQTSFPKDLDLKDVQGFDVAKVTLLNAPKYNQDTQRCVEGTPEFINGEWQQVWIVSDLSQEEIETNRQLKFKQLLDQFDNALTSHLDSVAQSKRYDNRITCALRAGFAGPFQQEGIAFATWMDLCNSKGYEILNAVQLGLRDIPESTEAFIAELPVIQWPTSTTT